MSLSKKIVDVSRQLRREQTEEETKLWQHLRNRKISGLKFLRQHPIEYQYVEGQPYFFVADFYCDEKKLVIEVDGKIHDFQKDYDANRDVILASLGLKIRAFVAQLPSSTHPRLRFAKSSPLFEEERGQIERSEIRGELAILLLAAGSSSRMGQSKQLLPIQGEPLLLRTTKSALQSKTNHVVVVLGANANQHEDVIRQFPVTIIVNDEWEKGMGSSIKAGLKHLLHANPNLKAVLILVCDQPLLTTDLLDEIISSYQKTDAKIIASFYGGSFGVPALFDQSTFPQLLRLEDQQGAKKVILRNSEQVHSIQWPDGEVDLDTWDEYLLFNEKF